MPPQQCPLEIESALRDEQRNFFNLNTPMERPEYMRIPIHLIPDEIIQEYNTTKYMHDGFIYIEIVKGMYGLAQAGLLANKLLAKRLDPIGYRTTKHTHGLWKHDTKPIQFALVVDDFGIEYQNKTDAEELINALKHTLQSRLRRLGRKTLLRDHPGMGLHQPTCRPQHAGLH
jgi:hypothetical protein